MFRYSICAFLAPAVASAMAMPWAGPEPTMYVPDIDGWSPAPTPAPEAPFLEILKRQDVPGDNTCGYLSASSLRSLTCVNANYVCATNSFYGVHGCCDPRSMAACSIPTACIPSTRLAASCTGGCSSNSFIAKCTNALIPACYEWHYVYPGNTVMTEYGCGSVEYTSSVSRFYSGQIVPGGTSADDPTISYVTVTPTSNAESSSSSLSSSESSETSTPTPTLISDTNDGGSGKKTNVGAIAGGVVGGVVVLAALGAGLIFLCLRSRKKKQLATGTVAPPHGLGAEPQMGQIGQMGQMGPAPGVTEFKPQPLPQGFPPSPGPQFADPATPSTAAAAAGGYYHSDNKTGFHQQQSTPHEQEVGSMTHPYSPPMTPAPQYSMPHNNVQIDQVAGVPAGVAEAGGEEVQPGARRESVQAAAHRQSIQSGAHRDSVQSGYQPGPGPSGGFLNQPGHGTPPQQHNNGPIYEAP